MLLYSSLFHQPIQLTLQKNPLYQNQPSQSPSIHTKKHPGNPKNLEKKRIQIPAQNDLPIPSRNYKCNLHDTTTPPSHPIPSLQSNPIQSKPSQAKPSPYLPTYLPTYIPLPLHRTTQPPLSSLTKAPSFKSDQKLPPRKDSPLFLSLSLSLSIAVHKKKYTLNSDRRRGERENISTATTAAAAAAALGYNNCERKINLYYK